MTGLLLIILLAALVVVFMQRKKNPEMATPVLYGLVVLIFLVSGARLFCTGRRGTAVSEVLAATQAFQEASAYRLGQAVAEDMDSGSAILVVCDGSDHDFARRNREVMVSGFQEGLGGGYTVHTFEVQPPRPEPGPDGEIFEEPIDEMFLRPEDLMEALSRYPDTSAVVSFMGLPFFRSPPRPGAIPPLYVMGGMEDAQSPLVQRGMVNAMVAYRTSGVDWNARPRRGMSKEEVFDLRFTLERPGR